MAVMIAAVPTGVLASSVEMVAVREAAAADGAAAIGDGG